MAQRPQQPQQNQLSCRRCNLVFPTWEARRRHIRESINHNVCYLCHSIVRDFETFNALQDHLDSFHFYCEPCDFFAPSVQGLMQHNLSVHNMCGVCREYFRNIHELNGVNDDPSSCYVQLEWTGVTDSYYYYSTQSQSTVHTVPIASSAVEPSPRWPPSSTTSSPATAPREQPSRTSKT